MYYEYLKVMIICGYEIPRLSTLQLITSEKYTLNVTALEMIRSYSQLLTTYVDRGGSIDFACRLLCVTWCFKRIVVNRKTKINYPYPFFLLYSPICLGGVGRIPYSIYGASLDALIYLMSNKK